MANEDLIELPETPDEPTYDIGYKKPPQHSQFKAGQSGNPKGRPKGAKGLTTLLEKAMKETVTVQKNGRSLKASKLEVAVTHMANKAVQGDHRAFQYLVPLLREMEAKAEGQKKEMALTEADLECIRMLPQMYKETSEK
jgi:hypothetical protein